MNRGLIIFAREPVPGRVKTRLAVSIGDGTAAKLYEAMIRNVLKTCREICDVETVVYWDCDETSLPLLANLYECLSRRQAAGDLGIRMQSAFEDMFASGYEFCCIIGSDAPDLPVAYIQEAFNLLTAQKTDTVFGPCRDGGYYLLGMSRFWPQLFSNIDWSTPQVLQQSLEATDRTGIKATLLPEWYDIDTQDDLEIFLTRNRTHSCSSLVGYL
ncbi:MAG: TIGR04282 family arsenosugar biosynthesis glycosyltransferase [Desulfuromonadales bacterium]